MTKAPHFRREPIGRSGFSTCIVSAFIIVLTASSGYSQELEPPPLPACSVDSDNPLAAAQPSAPADAEAAPEASSVSEASPPPTPPFGITGDWAGIRNSLLEEGVDLRTNLTQFYQGVTTGGLRDKFRYGLKFDYFGTVNGEALLGIKGLFVNLHGESRFGQSSNRDDGALLPSNFALQFPKAQGNASALTNMQIQQFLSKDFVVTFGKINTADSMNVYPFMGGYGTDRFMNTGFIINPIYGRAVPYSTPGAGFSYLHNLDPLFTLLVVDPTGRADTSGISHLFNNGASLFSQLRIPVKPFGLPGHQYFEGVWSSGKFNPLSSDSYVILPDVGIRANRKTGTWAITYGFDQFLIVSPDDPRKGFGVFGNLSLSDGDPNPVRWFLNLGIGGTSPIPTRSADSFGLAYYYLATSDSLKETLREFFPLRNEQGFELYYNAAITDWFILSADIQAMDPARFDARSTLLFGLRAKIVF